MKTICNEIDSKDLVELFSKFDEHRERYISIEWVELTKMTVSRRNNIGDPLRQVEVDCIKVRGKSLLGWSGDSTNGTRYVYSGELLFTHLSNWLSEKLQIRREEKINSIGI
jgi:hypothetical protein